MDADVLHLACLFALSLTCLPLEVRQSNYNSDCMKNWLCTRCFFSIIIDRVKKNNVNSKAYNRKHRLRRNFSNQYSMHEEKQEFEFWAYNKQNCNNPHTPLSLSLSFVSLTLFDTFSCNMKPYNTFLNVNRRFVFYYLKIH